MKKLFVANIPWATTEQDLHDLFSQAGTVQKVQIIIERESGRSRGFGFVEMPNDAEAQAAISNFNGYKGLGRPLVVNEAKPQPHKPPRMRL